MQACVSCCWYLISVGDPQAYGLILLRGGTSEHKTPATKVIRTVWNLLQSLSITLQILKTSAQSIYIIF
jgi:hypothetical protein